MSIEQFLIFINYCNSNFKENEIIYHIETNEFKQTIKNKFEDEKNFFVFYFNPFRSFLKENLKYLIKNFFYLFKKKDFKIFEKKDICVMDAFDMNNPDIFFSDKNFYEKILFITRDKNEFLSKCINVNYYINFKIFLYLLYLYFKKNIFFRSHKIINFSYVNYAFEKKIYHNLFKKNNIKILLSSHIHQAYNVSAVAAINELGGEAVGYTMSFQEIYESPYNIDSLNYFFSFNNSKHTKFKYSNLKKILPLGYINDYKFLDCKNEAEAIRKKFLASGAKYIIGFFDQGSVENNMWEIGHDISSNSYKFLLEKIINDKNFALIIKPKKPKLLKYKLGNVYDLLNKAKETGRCLVFENYSKHHVKNFDDIPAKVAMASDLTIHDTLAAGTAGLESALTGTKSIYFDYFGLKKSQFDDNHLNIVYRDWNILWENVKKDSEEKLNSLGNWHNIIDKFDSYRDGKTNIRMMNFINKLIKEKNPNFN